MACWESESGVHAHWGCFDGTRSKRKQKLNLDKVIALDMRDQFPYLSFLCGIEQCGGSETWLMIDKRRLGGYYHGWWRTKSRQSKPRIPIHWPFAKYASYCFGVNVFFEEGQGNSKRGWRRACLTCENACIWVIWAFNAALTASEGQRSMIFAANDVHVLSLCFARVDFPSNAYGRWFTGL